MMDLSRGYMSNEHWELLRSASESADPLSVSPLEISPSPRTPRSPKSPKSPRSPNGHFSKHGSGKGSPLKNDGHSQSGIDGRPKKGGSGGKGTCGGLLDTDDSHTLDQNDPNYTSTEENEPSRTRNSSSPFVEYRKQVAVIVEEYFATDDIISTANEIRELGMSSYNYYFVKKLVSMAMDRHDKEKEMAAVLLSSLYADTRVQDTVGFLALFISRAVVDDILPPAFLTKEMTSLPKDSKGVYVMHRASKNYLSAPLHAEIIEWCWGGSRNKTVEDVKDQINNLLIECVVNGNKKEACRCIKYLKVPFFHHEIVKRAIIMAMEKRQSEDRLLDLLKTAAEGGLINSSQISKGFSRIIDTVDDLSLDIPNARQILQSLISKAASEGWLCASSLKSVSLEPEKRALEDSAAKAFKLKAHSLIQEYFLSGDITEVCCCLESENSSSSSDLNAIFVKKLITLSMDRKNWEKEMASVLLSSLCFPADDVVNGFVMLIESADDTALDIPVVVEDLEMFFARAVVDEVLAPLHLDEIGTQCLGPDSIGNKVLQMAKSLLKA